MNFLGEEAVLLGYFDVEAIFPSEAFFSEFRNSDNENYKRFLAATINLN